MILWAFHPDREPIISISNMTMVFIGVVRSSVWSNRSFSNCKQHLGQDAPRDWTTLPSRGRNGESSPNLNFSRANPPGLQPRVHSGISCLRLDISLQLLLICICDLLRFAGLLLILPVDSFLVVADADHPWLGLGKEIPIGMPLPGSTQHGLLRRLKI